LRNFDGSPSFHPLFKAGGKGPPPLLFFRNNSITHFLLFSSLGPFPIVCPGFLNFPFRSLQVWGAPLFSRSGFRLGVEKGGRVNPLAGVCFLSWEGIPLPPRPMVVFAPGGFPLPVGVSSVVPRGFLAPKGF